MVAPKATIAQCEEALIKNYGNVSAASRSLNYDSHAALSDRIKRHKRLQIAKETGRERFVDMAEHSLMSLVRDKNVPATLFSLKCLAKDRGYIESPVHGAASDDVASVLAEFVKKCPV